MKAIQDDIEIYVETDDIFFMVNCVAGITFTTKEMVYFSNNRLIGDK